MERLYKISEVSRMLGFSKASLKRWIKEGSGPDVTFSPGGHYLFKESDIDAWQEKMKREHISLN